MVLSGCEKKSLLHVYEYPSLNDDTVIFDYTDDVYIIKDQEEYDNSDAIRNRMFDFMGNTYDLVYDETKTKEFLPYAEDRYHDQSNKNSKKHNKWRYSFLSIPKEEVLIVKGMELSVVVGKLTMRLIKHLREMKDTFLET